MAAAGSVGSQHHASLNLMACVRESSPQQEDFVSDSVDSDLNRHGDPSNKKRRFHPFRGLRRIFRKKSRHQQQVASTELQDPESAPEQGGLLESGTPVQALDAHRSRSTSTLLSGDDSCPRRRSGNGLYPCHSGLSVSHDSVFTAEHRTPHSSSEDLDTAQSSSSLSIQQLVLPGVRAELFDALRRRGRRDDCTSEDDEDLGLPHSPCNSPTTADVLLEKGIKENATKSHSTCSDGSLLSMGSSEMDEDSLGQHSGHSSKVSLHDKKPLHDHDIEFDLGVSAAPLSHSAARHKMAVKPKRTHGAPRRRRIQQLAGASPLPSTPELNEEVLARSASPEVKVINPELTAWSPEALLPAETHLKSASLPPGLALTPNAEAIKVKRCNSNISERRIIETDIASERRAFGAVGEEDEEMNEEDREDKKRDDSSFFSRLIRRSGKKKKEGSDSYKAVEMPSVAPKRIDLKGRYANEPTSDYLPPSLLQTKYGTRSTPASRQRVKPINIPASPEGQRKAELEEIVFGLPLPASPSSPEPELEAHFMWPEDPVSYPLEEREYTSLIDTVSSEEAAARQHAVKKSKSFRRETTLTGETNRQSQDSDVSAKYPAFEDSKKVDAVSDFHGRLFAKNVAVTDNSPVLRICNRQSSCVMKKSSSLDSIGSFSESKKLASPESLVSSKKSSSSESVSSCTQATSKPPDQQGSKMSAPASDQVPEFLKVQLNRVDNKPVTTSMVFDSTERNSKAPDSWHVGMRRKESFRKTEAAAETLSVQKKPSQEQEVEEVGNVVFDSQTKSTKPTSLLSTAGHVSESSIKVCTVSTTTTTATTTTTTTTSTNNNNNSNSNSNNKNNVIIRDSSASQKQRSKSLPSSNQMNVANRKFSVVSISSSKPVLRKQAISLDSAEGKKPVSKDCEVEVAVDEKVDVRKKRSSKEWKEQETAPCNKTSDSASIEVILRSRKMISTREISNKKDEVERRVSGGTCREEENETAKQENNKHSDAPEVILRKKSLSRCEISRGKDEEPELLKVFARRSLKLKDSECEALGQQVAAKSDQQRIKSRDSDKENEGGDSPREERKKQPIKEPLTESKVHMEPAEPALVLKSSSAAISLTHNGLNKYQRSLSSGVNDHAEQSSRYRKEIPVHSPDKRQRNKTIPESPKTETLHRVWAAGYKEKEIDIISSEPKRSEVETSTSQAETHADIPQFKRIQQRKEEWELRAQQALKKTLP